jgi:hypothetical protein
MSLSDLITCSGDWRVFVAMQESTRIGWVSLGICAVLTVALGYDFFRQQARTFVFPISAGLLAIHPGIWVSAYRGDCGMLRRDASIQISIVFGILFLTQLGVSVWKKGRVPSV